MKWSGKIRKYVAWLLVLMLLLGSGLEGVPGVDSRASGEAETNDTSTPEPVSGATDMPVSVAEASETPTPEPEVEVTETPIPEPEAEATATPIPEPEVEATGTPVPKPEVEATDTPVPEPVAETTNTPVPEPEVETTDTPVPEPEPTAEPLAHFSQGYVFLKKNSIVYKQAARTEELGTLKTDGTVYAELDAEADDPAQDWLKIVFDTQALRDGEADFAVGYVQFQTVDALDDEKAQELTVQLGNDPDTRRAGSVCIPCVEFEEKITQPEATDAPGEGGDSSDTESTEARVIATWYDKGTEGSPLKIHVTTSLQTQYLYLYQGDSLLASWSADEAEIDENSANKEWHVSYTFEYSGQYYLWYRASVDGTVMSPAYSPDPANIERPALLDVWYEKGIEKKPLKIHATTNLDMQHLYLYLGENQLVSWSADEAEIVEYATCKEWVVDYTFDDPGAYYLWYKASADGTTMSLPYSPKAVQIERPAVIEVWYEKGLENSPLKIHATTNLDMQHLYLYLGENELGHWSANEAEIMEYAACKEWVVEHTFEDPGAYYLWYKASVDGKEMSQAYAPAPAQVERPAVLQVWYEEATAGTPLKIHATTNLDMQHLYLYLGEEQLATWNADEAEIVAYPACKEWVVEHTFKDPGAYYLWYKASKDGTTDELPFAPDPVNIAAPSGELTAPAWESVRQEGLSAILSWQAVEGATGYEISMSQGESDTFSVIGDTTETTLTTDELTAGTTCVFRLRAYQQSGEEKTYSEYSENRSLTVSQEEPHDEFTYAVNEAGTGVVIVKYHGNDAAVVIPDSIDGMPVTEIGDEAFLNNSALTSITVPQTVERIGARAFKGCTRLQEMN